MNKSTMVLFLLTITIFGATSMMALQGAVAQNYYNNEQTYADHYLPSTNYGEEGGNDNSYSYNNYYPPDVNKYECQKVHSKDSL